MIAKLIFCLLSVALAFRGHGNELTCDVYEQAYLALDNFITHNPAILPTLVRAAFSDCVGESCDGCLNFNDPHNAGLSAAIQAIDLIFEGKSFFQHMSRADWWQLAAQVALIRGGLNQGCRPGARKCTFFELQFWYGRKDCRTSPYHHYPDDTGSPQGDYKELWRVLHGNFALEHQELVALLGAHSLGGAHRTASGFNYNWQIDSLIFDNQYFKNLISLPYQLQDVSTTPINGTAPPALSPHRYQFSYLLPHNESGLSNLLMLTTDMSLLKAIRAERDEDGELTGVLRCRMGRKVRRVGVGKGVRKCKDAPTAPVVYEFAQNLELFYESFVDGWWKMVSHGSSGLRLPRQEGGDCGYCIPEGAYCVAGFEKAGECCPGNKCVQHKCTRQ